ncbi:hypothetical protein NHX12_010298 [Muraenolepis orangiensis]|uniref:ferroxidase n=1 Tax=Muraenolepis orangiensis TaxID=630683 RepID=A0A9Q0I970_9TELE|nr:hypothetical protein NHX12_010298 [Muraenolepis orangiensis]
MLGTSGLLVCASLLLLLLMCARGEVRKRVYYIGIIEDSWDYAPSGRNLIKDVAIADDEDSAIFLEPLDGRIGSVYKKAMFRQYTDEAFTRQVPRPAWLGYLGPVIKAEVGNHIVVHLKNMASRNYSIHPHGVFYEKGDEGALYPDQSGGLAKKDDAVPPGGTYTYLWKVRPEFGPTEDDPNCMTWVYHSHVDAPRDIASGLIGALLTCKQGTLDLESELFTPPRNDVDQDLVLMFNVVDESLSWYLQDNMQVCCTGSKWVDMEDEEFMESNLMHAINGYMFGNLPDLVLCQHRTVSWHLFGMGNEVDIHSVYFHGGTVLDRGHRTDVLSLFPATFVTAEMVPSSLGRWLLSCQVNDHLRAGMQAFYMVNTCGDEQNPSMVPGVLREYYVAAEEVTWDYGPVLRGEVGDTIRVTFRNSASRNYSIQPHGLQVDHPGSEGGAAGPGSRVGPGETFVYTWRVLDGPSPSDPACIPYLYFSGTDAPKDTNSGLVGPLLVCKRGSLGTRGVQTDVDKEFFLLYSIMDENESWYIDSNTQQYSLLQPATEEAEDAIIETVNGLMYGNLEGLELCLGERVVWYTFGMGTEMDIHGVYFEGNNFQRQNTTRDTVSVFPHTTATLDMQPQSLGTFDVACRVTDHYSAGMRHHYQVGRCPGRNGTSVPFKATAVARYFISVEEIEWDYFPNATPSSVFVEGGDQRIGSRYKKAVYRAYTDETFDRPMIREEHLGILGPMIQAQVGEQIQITFRNNAKRPYSIHAHGIHKSSRFPALNPVQPGFITNIEWDIPKSSGPGPSDPDCITFAYFSPVDFIKDMYSGLLGPLVICRPGTLDTATRNRISPRKEFALLFLIFDENLSWYLDDNMAMYLQGAATPDLKDDDDFRESNKMHGINGLLYGNLRGLVMRTGQCVAWYLLGMGGEVDLHTVHFHAETFLYRTDQTHRADVFDLFPGTFQTVEMQVGNPGIWLLHCHVTDHIHAGMETTFTIVPDTNVVEAAAVRTRGSMASVVLSLCLLLMRR